MAFSFDAVPNLSSLTGVRQAVVSVPHQRRRALTGPCVLVPDGSSVALLDHHAEVAVPLSSLSTFTCVGVVVPHFPVQTEDTFRSIKVEVVGAVTLESGLVPYFPAATFRLNHTTKPVPEVSIRAETLLNSFVPNSVSGTLNLSLTVVPIPDIISWTIAGSLSWVPLLSVDTQQAQASIVVVAGLTNTLGAIPRLSTRTPMGFTPVSVPMGSIGAYTPIFAVGNLPIFTGDNLHAVGSVPIAVQGTFTHELEHIPFFSVLADLDCCASEAIPPCAFWTLTDVLFVVEDSATHATETSCSVPVETCWTLTFIVRYVQKLT